MSRPDAPFINNAMKLNNRLLLSVLVVTSLVSGCDSFKRAGSEKIYDAQILDCNGNLLVSFAPYTGTNSHRSIENIHHYGNLAYRTLGHYDPPLIVNDGYGLVWSCRDELFSGHTLKRTINIRLQAVADSLLRKSLAGKEHLESACIVVQNIMTGEIPVIVNLGRNFENELSECFNYAVREYEPGEVLSPASWMVALDDGMAYSHADLSDAIASGKLSRVYEMVPDHYVRTLKSFFLPDYYDGLGIDGLSIEICSPESANWNSSAVQHLIHGRDMFMSPVHVAAFYSSLAAGRISAPELVRNRASGCCGDFYDNIDTDIIMDALDSVGGAGLVGRESVSWKIAYDNGNEKKYSAETFAGIFPVNFPEYSIACVLFEDLPASGNEQVSGIAKNVSASLSEVIAGEDYEHYKSQESEVTTLCSEDGVVKVETWDTGTGGTSPNFRSEMYLKRPSGKYVKVNAEFLSDVFVQDLHCVRKNDGNCYYFAVCYGRASSIEATRWVKAFRLTINGGVMEVDLLDGKWRSEDERMKLYVDYDIPQWYDMFESCGFDWLFHYDASSCELYVPQTDGMNLLDGYDVLHFDGEKFVASCERKLKLEKCEDNI